MSKAISTDEDRRVGVAGSARSKAPVFVLGCPRSGTTLLYHMLLSAGGFAVYRAETHVFNMLEPAYGNLSHTGNKKRLMKAWIGSKLFRVSGLEAAEIEAKVLTERCNNGGDFLRIVMGEVARKQNVDRWSDCTPDHLLYLRRIKETIPEALIVHIIRDGRDVALSMDKQGWIRPLRWHGGDGLIASSLYWEWIVNRGRRIGQRLGADYCEVRFEELTKDPRAVLRQLSPFIEQTLDYDRILEVGIGSVREPNSSFGGLASGDGFNPAGRWRQALSERDLIRIEAVTGGTLRELGYELATAGPPPSERSRLLRMRRRSRRYFDFKLWMKARTPAGRWFVTKDLSWL